MLKRKIRLVLVILFLLPPIFSIYFYSSLTQFPPPSCRSFEPRAESNTYPEADCYSWTALWPVGYSRFTETKAKTPLQSCLCSLCNTPSRCSQGTYVSDVHAGKLSRPVRSSFVKALPFFVVLNNIFVCVFIESSSSILDAGCVQVGNSANTICVWFVNGALLQ